MKKVILTPNPYRDRNFQTVRTAAEVLQKSGIEVRMCLPFEVDKGCDLPRDIRFSRLDKELPTADAVVCFGILLSVGRGTAPVPYQTALSCNRSDSCGSLGHSLLAVCRGAPA